MTHRFPEPLQALIAHLKKFPGVGTRTAERFAFDLLSWEPHTLQTLAQHLATLPQEVPPCTTCGCLTDKGKCRFCTSTNRDPTSLCILASARDAYALEEAGGYRGLYHVVEHLLSPLDGRNTINLSRILARLTHTTEVILAFDSTLEGDATALYLKEHLAERPLRITRLAFGLPMGSPLDHIDSTTLARSLSARMIV